jgi:succinate dehydrogenase/fumarate reductase flavoprotein subunit
MMPEEKTIRNQMPNSESIKEDLMSEEKEQPKRLSRKEFVKGAAVGAGALAGASALAGCGPATTPAETAEPCPTCPAAEECPPCEAAWMPTSWDKEADVVVVGAGFAAQAAAITAFDAGVSVLMLEKAPEEFQGGNSRVCGQGFLSPSSAIWEDYYKYLDAATTGLGFPVNPDEDFSDETLRFYTEESSKNVAWFESLGATVIDDTVAFGGMIGNALWIPFYPHFPGADAIASEPGWYRVGGDYDGAGGNWYFLEDQILERGIEKLFESPAKRLVQDPVTREVLGVVAESGGQEIYVKAKRAVCVCAGGWEFNQQMVRDFQGIPVLYGIGSPYNTGETIKMCWAAGADIRNMSAIAAPAGWSAGILPGYESAQLVSLSPAAGGSIVIGANNKRFHNEYREQLYGGLSGKTYEERKALAGQEGTVSSTGQEIRNGVFVRWDRPLPAHMIFDDAARLSGALFGMMGMGWAAGVEGYEPSADNSVELEAGWFIVADTIEELATKMGRDPDEVQDTINRWNQSCAAGVDEEYGRTANLTPIEGPPYYAIEIFPECLNTQGGMLRNIKSQVLDIEGDVIPRLYSAGENGDIWTIVYQCMSNVGGGCYAYGRVAGANAAAEEPWE